jgi:peptidoglycan/LPS O-acetylase OafA/YrhL
MIDRQTPPQQATASGRLPGLDGLRALSIVLVLCFHLITLPGSPQSRWFIAFATRGNFGVEIFFVLSGFIITWLLLKEENKTGSTDLRQFYIRRAFRILPPALLYLGVISLLVLAHRSAASWGEIGSAALFARNLYGLYGPGSADTGHFWTLAVEEQFYLTWPFLFVLLGKRGRAILLIALLAISPIWHHEYSRLFPNTKLNVYEFHYEPLLMGCLLAVARNTESVGRFLSASVFRSPWIVVACVAIIAPFVTPSHLDKHVSEKVRALFPLIQYFSIAMVINYVIQGRRSPIDRLLNVGPMIFIGQLSYSLYLWQQLFCLKGATLQLSMPLCFAAAMACAMCSYYIVEQPALRLRQQLSRCPTYHPTPIPLDTIQVSTSA